MKLFFSALFIGIACRSAAQDSLYKFKKQWPVYACFAGAGLSYGTAEALIWHTPYPTSTFWNPYLSWRYDRRIDGYHLARGAGIGFFIAAACLSVNDIKHPFKKGVLKKLIYCSIFYWVGQQITWQTVK